MAQQTHLFYRFGVALFIGVLVGLQREYAFDDDESRRQMFAGVRTFALMGLAGCTAAFVADSVGSALAFVGIVFPLGLLVALGYAITAWRGDVGMTTEMAAMVTILAGAICYWNNLALAVAIGVATTVLLSLKLEARRFVAHLTRDDILATLKFAVITAIILPVLPNQAPGPPPFDVLNPYKIWLMVVLISGISFLGYVLMKFVTPQQGISLTGLLGGLASSTATTLSFSQRSRKNQAFAKTFALAITLAWGVMFARALVEVGTLNPPLLEMLLVPMLAAAGAGLAYAGYLYLFSARNTDEEDLVLSNPFELGTAIKFGVIYAGVLLISRAAELYFGNTGIYVSSVVSGLADVDAIALTMAELSSSGNLELTIAARAVMMAAMANTVAKGGIAIVAGSPALRRALLPGLILILATGISLIFLI